jgi:hypothetical protein
MFVDVICDDKVTKLGQNVRHILILIIHKGKAYNVVANNINDGY